jgi:uncharacterized membrane protein
MQKNVRDWERIASVAVGAGMLVMAFRKRRSRPGMLAFAAGLVARGVSGRCVVNKTLGRSRVRMRDDTRLALGGPRGVHLKGSVVIRRPAQELYEFWRDLRNLPKFMPHLERIDMTGEKHSRWVIKGPGGAHLEWDAEIINAVPPQLIGWRSLKGADVASAGSVSFHQISPAETEVRVKMQYAPMAGRTGALLAWLAGTSPSSMLQRDLGRLKDMIERSPALA